MCVIAYKPAGVKIPEENLEACFKSNKDGAGFTVQRDGQLTTIKGLWTYRAFFEAFEPYQNDQALIHFRIRTHGTYGEDNCHPFLVSDGMVFAHNGVISSVPNDREKSDTVVFNELILRNLVKTFGKESLFDPVIQSLIMKYVGASKLAFLLEDGRHILLPEEMGWWYKDAWYSNQSYKPIPPPKPLPPTPPSRSDYPSYLGRSKNHTDMYGRKTIREAWDDYFRSLDRTRPNEDLADVEPPKAALLEDKSKKDKPRLTLAKDNVLVLGTYVKFGTDWGTITKGCLGKVTGFYPDNGVEVYVASKQFCVRVPGSSLIKLAFKEAKA